MSCRYQVRVFESVEQNGATGAGTTVRPSVQTFSIYAYSAEEAENTIQKRVANGKLARGRVYQIWPFLGNGEFTRSLAIACDGSCQHVWLDPAAGPFNELRRIRVPQAAAANERSSVASGAAPA
jgi:hypothetical protein